jgi:hypothetical protein
MIRTWAWLAEIPLLLVLQCLRSALDCVFAALVDWFKLVEWIVPVAHMSLLLGL